MSIPISPFPILSTIGQESSRATPADGSFADVLEAFLESANEAQHAAGAMSEKLVGGTLQATHQMSIVGAKAEVMLHLTTQIAAKLSSATTQLMQMQL